MLRETEKVEFKREYSQGIIKTAIAFANGEGGEIWVGVDDDGTCVGVDDLDDVELRIRQGLRDAIEPDITLFVDMERRHTDGCEVLIVKVRHGNARPYYWASKGMCSRGVYVRQGASTTHASDAAVVAMIRENAERFEILPAGRQALSFRAAEEIFACKNMELGPSQHRSMHTIDNSDAYTQAGWLISDQNTAAVKCAVFQGLDHSIFRNRAEFQGSVLSQPDEVTAFLDRYNAVKAEFTGNQRIDVLDYPPEAVREAVLNAIVHRDYGHFGPTLVSVFDDRIEIVSLGGLVNDLSVNDLALGISSLRNPHLANIFYRLGFIEAFGTGLPKIREAYRGSEKQPDITVSDNAFRIVLPNRNYTDAEEARYHYDQFNMLAGRIPLSEVTEAADPAISPSAEAVYRAMLSLARPAFRKELQEQTTFSQATTIRGLKELQDAGLVGRRGSGPRTQYILKQSALLKQ